MAELDAFIMGRVGPQLRPGEHVMGIGWVRQVRRINVLGVPQEYDDYLAAATSQRLILLRTEPATTLSLLVEKVKPLCREVVVWEYREIAKVDLGQVAGLSAGACFFALSPHGPLGPYEGRGKRYDIYPKVRDLDGQAQFYGQFPGWIQQQIASGAFPMDEAARQKIAAHEQRLAAEAQARRERDEARRQRMEAFFQRVMAFLGGAKDASGKVRLKPATVLLIGAIAATLVTLGSAGMTYNEYDSVEFYEHMRKSSIANSKNPIYSASERKRQAGLAKEDEEKIVQKQVSAVIWTIVTVLLLGGSATLFVLASKKRKAAAAAPPQPAAFPQAQHQPGAPLPHGAAPQPQASNPYQAGMMQGPAPVGQPYDPYKPGGSG